MHGDYKTWDECVNKGGYMTEKYSTFKGLKIPTELEKHGVTVCGEIKCWGVKELECADCILASVNYDHKEKHLKDYLETRGGK